MASRTVRMVLVAAATLAAAGGCSTKELSTSTTAESSSTTTSTASPNTTQPRSSTSSTSSTTAAAGGDATVVPDPTWGLNAAQYRGQNGLRLRVDCPPDGTIYSVWGTGTYTDDTSICTAGVHAGLITLAAGGTVVIEIAPGLEEYAGTEANGIVSTSYGPWGGSYTFVS